VVRVTSACSSARPTALATKPETQMSTQNPQLVYDPAERAAEKQRSREADERALREGRVSRDDLRVRNAFLSPHGGRIDYAGAGPHSLW
jgi:hypothetical protein